MDADGMTVASSNRKDPDSFVRKSNLFRPYFQEAAKGHVTFIDPAALRTLGFAVAEMLDQSAHSLIHHSHEDGSGYPRGLKGQEILPEARIISLADMVDAMASHRQYRAALGIDVAPDEVKGS
jgi:HD-GYP domain-containing protein (c-di-GMP phosphodiesterase class II)